MVHFGAFLRCKFNYLNIKTHLLNIIRPTRPSDWKRTKNHQGRLFQEWLIPQFSDKMAENSGFWSLLEIRMKQFEYQNASIEYDTFNTTIGLNWRKMNLETADEQCEHFLMRCAVRLNIFKHIYSCAKITEKKLCKPVNEKGEDSVDPTNV